MSKLVYYDDASKYSLTGSKYVYVDENGTPLNRELLKDYDLSNPIYYSNPTSNPRVGNEFKGDDTQNQRALAAHVQNVRKGLDNLLRIKDLALTVAGFVPIVGDALGGYLIYDDVRRGAYTAAGIGLGAMFLPSALRGIGKGVRKGILKSISRSFLPDKEGTYYYSNRRWNIPKITEDILQGTQDAVNFYNSNTYKQTLRHNAEVAKRLGFNFEPTLNIADRVSTKPLKIDIQSISYPGFDIYGQVLHGTTPTEDVIKYNIYHQLLPIAFHENIHRGFYGTAPKVNYYNLPYYDWAKKLKSTNSFYLLKNLKILKSRSDIPTEDRVYWDYLDDPSESATNLLETGYRLKIPLGKSYPGDTDFFNIIENTSIAKYYKLNTLKDRKNVWKALTGQYFIMPLAIGTGYSLFSRGSHKDDISD